MKILVTGSFGNVGSSVLDALVSKKHQITCYDKKTLENLKTSRKYKKFVKIIWGDIRDYKKVESVVENQDVIIHLAAIVPPKTIKNERKTEQVNFGGTKNIVEAIKKQPNKPKLIYTSSVAVYGDVRNKKSPILTEDAPYNPSPSDFYAVTKINSEKLIKKSSIQWSIFRLSYIPNSKQIKLTPLMFRMPLDTPIEFTLSQDCGVALANAVDKKEIWGHIINLGGGKNCQIYYRDYLNKMLPLLGVELLPDSAFSTESFHCCFYKTDEIQKLLKFQKHNFDDLINEMVTNARSKRFWAKLFKPVVRPFLLSLSPFYKENKKSQKK